MLFAIGILLMIGQFLSNVSSYVQSVFVHVEHPLHYNFNQYNQILAGSVEDDLVNYRQLAHSQELANAVHELEKISPDKIVDENEQIAFWLNTYNLLTLKAIADHYPIQNLSQIAEDLSLHKYIVGGQTYSLSEIEADKLLPLISAGKPLSVFLVCGGTIGYPPLLDHAVGQNLDAEAKAQARKFINSRQNVLFDADSETLFLSPFFKWHERLFQKDYGTPFDLVNSFFPADKKMDLASAKITRTYMRSFDMRINDIGQRKLRE